MIRLLGTIALPIDLPHIPQALIAYLATHSERPFHRDELVDRLALGNRKELRQHLWRLGPLKEALLIDGDFVGFNGYPTDVIEFEFSGKLDAYGGPLLPGWQDDWALYQRVRLDMLFFDRALSQMRLDLAARRFEDVETIAAMMLRVDPSFTPALDGMCESLDARDLPEVAERYRVRKEALPTLSF